MKFSLKTKETIAELTIQDQGMVITSDLAYFDSKIDNWVVEEEIVEQLITCARDLKLFNCGSDIEFVKKIYQNFLDDYEKQQFKEQIASL